MMFIYTILRFHRSNSVHCSVTYRPTYM